MKNLFVKIFFLFILIGATLWLFYSRQAVTYSENNYLASLIDKNILLENTNSPRIILVGASNVAFGFDSKKIEKEFSMPVINTGIHGNLGLAFILNDVRSNMRKGDIIILAIEYFLGEFDYNTLNYAVNLFPKGRNYIDYNLDFYRQKVNYTFNELQLYRKKMQNKIFGSKLKLKELKVNAENDMDLFDTAIYARNKFNSNGDMIGHLDKLSLTEIRGRKKLEEEDYDYYINLLNDFYEFAREKGAEVYFTFPCYPLSELEKYRKVIFDYEKNLKENLKIPILNNPYDLGYPDSLFFDTVYHLNAEGRQKRTDYTIDLLKEKVFRK